MSKVIIPILWTGLLFTDIFLFKEMSDVMKAVILILSIIWLIRYRTKALTTFKISIFFFLLMVWFKLAGQEMRAEKSAIWVYFFLLLGTCQLLKGYFLSRWKKS